MKQKLIQLKGEMDKSTMMVGKLQYSSVNTDRTTKQKISKDIEELNNTISQQNLIDIYRKLHPTTQVSIVFSSVHGTYTKIKHILGHKTLREQMSYSMYFLDTVELI